MSLHNSTVIENQIWTNLLIGWSKRHQTKFKAQRSGFGFEEEKESYWRSFRRGESRQRKRSEDDFLDEDQAKKGARGMPWHQEPMKDVISCEKLRGAANELRSGDIRMGKPTARYRILNQIGIWGEPPELKHLSRARKRNQKRFRK